MDEDTNGIEAQEVRATRPQRVSGLRRFFQAQQLYESVQPLFVITFWHGLTPFFIKSDGAGNKKLKESIFGYINTFLHITIYVACYMLTLINDFETVAGYFFNSGVSRFGDTLQILSGLIGVTIIYITAMLPKQRLEYSLRTVQDIDLMLHKVGVKIIYTKLLHYSYFSILLVVAVDTVYSCGNFMLLKSANLEPSTPLYIVFTLQHTVISIATMMYHGFVKMLEMRLTMLNESQLLGRRVRILLPRTTEMFRRFWNGLRNLRRDYRNPANIYASLRVVFLFAHFFGLTPYHIIISSKTRRHILCTSTYGYFAMASRFIFLHVNIMYSILHNHTVIEYFFTTDISHFTDSMQKYNGVAGNVIAMGFCFVQRKRLCTLVRRMHRIEERFFNVGVSFMQKYVATHTNRFALAIFALTIFYFQLSMFGILARNNIYISLPAAVSYYAPHLLICGIVQLYYAMIYKLTQYFRALNKVEYFCENRWRIA